MQLLNLTLSNFKGIKSFSFSPGGASADICGNNAAGKSTVFDAFCWLLFGKDSQGQSNFEIKTLGLDGEPRHNLEHAVEAVIFSEREIALKKIYREKWTKKRGKAHQVFEGHETDHFLDGVPVKKSEFQAAVDEICPADTFRLLSDPRFFPDVLHWQKRREILFSAFGRVSDSEVVVNSPALTEIPSFFQERSIEDHKKIISRRRADINKELEKIPVRIDELSRSLPDVSGLDAEKIKARIDILADECKGKVAEISRLENGGQIAELQKQLREIEAEDLARQTQPRQEFNAALDALARKASPLETEKIEIQSAIRICDCSRNAALKSIAMSDQALGVLRDEWKKINAEKLEISVESVCPACSQALPPGQVAAAREKAQASHNENKARRLADNVEAGKATAAKISALKQEVVSLQNFYDEKSVRLAAVENHLASLKAEQAALNKKGPVPVPPSPEIEMIKKQIEDLQAGCSAQVTAAEKELNEIIVFSEMARNNLALINSSAASLARIADLEKEEKALAAEFEKLENELFICDEFVRSKAALLESRINSKFSLARFKLFKPLINGGLEECCEVMVDGVPYSSLNNAMQINVGLDIINTLSDVFDFSAPVWIDNAEAVTEFVPVNAQLIKLYVSAGHKKLTVNIEEIEKTKAA
jgi:DNA repair exonuclease SbcCD ATPase subunit